MSMLVLLLLNALYCFGSVYTVLLYSVIVVYTGTLKLTFSRLEFKFC